jgi:hypothetical protein
MMKQKMNHDTRKKWRHSSTKAWYPIYNNQGTENIVGGRVFSGGGRCHEIKRNGARGRRVARAVVGQTAIPASGANNTCPEINNDTGITNCRSLVEYRTIVGQMAKTSYKSVPYLQ